MWEGKLPTTTLSLQTHELVSFDQSLYICHSYSFLHLCISISLHFNFYLCPSLSLSSFCFFLNLQFLISDSLSGLYLFQYVLSQLRPNKLRQIERMAVCSILTQKFHPKSGCPERKRRTSTRVWVCKPLQLGSTLLYGHTFLLVNEHYQHT